jgi:alpha-beta hydrolase superfamily lysophospholipase
MNVLVITYRNDAGAAPEEDGRHHFGATEWADLEAAAEFAVSQNAGELVLSGASMGGAIVMSFLNRSDLAELVTAVVLDAPVLDLETAVKHAAPGWAPGFILDAGMWFTSRRFDVDWEEVDYLRDTGRLQAPMLVFHGLEDDTVPAELSEHFAEARPDLVTYVPVAGAGHVRSWNADPERYMAALSAFLAEHAGAGE